MVSADDAMAVRHSRARSRDAGSAWPSPARTRPPSGARLRSRAGPRSRRPARCAGRGRARRAPGLRAAPRRGRRSAREHRRHVGRYTASAGGRPMGPSRHPGPLRGPPRGRSRGCTSPARGRALGAEDEPRNAPSVGRMGRSRSTSPGRPRVLPLPAAPSGYGREADHRSTAARRSLGRVVHQPGERGEGDPGGVRVAGRERAGESVREGAPHVGAEGRRLLRGRRPIGCAVPRRLGPKRGPKRSLGSRNPLFRRRDSNPD
jgi:hypothetical protein